MSASKRIRSIAMSTDLSSPYSLCLSWLGPADGEAAAGSGGGWRRGSSRSWLGLDTLSNGARMGLRGSMVLTKLIGRLGHHRRWGKFHAVRLAAVGGVCGRNRRRVGFPLLPLVAEAIDILPLLSEPLPLGLVHWLELPRTVLVPRRLVERCADEVPHG